MQKRKGWGGGKYKRKKIQRGIINSETEKQREQELGSGINEFHPEGIIVKWQLLPSAFTAILAKDDWQRKICPYTHGLPQVDVSVCARVRKCWVLPAGADRKQILLAFQKQIIYKDNASSGVGLCITLPTHFGFAQSYLIHAAKGFSNGLFVRWIVMQLQWFIFKRMSSKLNVPVVKASIH